jgi:hypothetical protein
MRNKEKLIFYIGIVLCLSVMGGSYSYAYDYPFENKYVATVVGTPPEYEASFVKDVDFESLELDVFPDRNPPDVFWYHNALRYGLAKQKDEAPLIFVIAGTGASYFSSNNLFLMKVFNDLGYHVVLLSSPTHPNFIVTASETGVPGMLEDDCEDMYRVMGKIQAQVEEKIDISEFYITGYSLGGAQAAFLSKIDEERRVFNFKKVLLINPPVDLYSSAQILDQMLLENIPGGSDHFNEFYDHVMNRFSEIYTNMEQIEFNDDFLYRLYEIKHPKDTVLEALIGISFRMSSANMVFTSDVMSNSGLIVPKNKILDPYESLTDYFKVGVRTSFTDYAKDLLFPYYQSQDPDITFEALIAQTSLKAIEDYLKSAEKISLVTNADDFILAEGQLKYLTDVFGDRAKIYPAGGHLGNLEHHEFVDHIVELFRK